MAFQVVVRRQAERLWDASVASSPVSVGFKSKHVLILLQQ